MRQTNNLGLCLIDGADKFSPDPINENTEKLDKLTASMTRANQLDNWYLADPVNQRGRTEYSGTAWEYTIDRWQTSNDSTKVTVGKGVTVSSTASDKVPYLLQTISTAGLMGKTVTLSVMLGDGTVKSASAVLPGSSPSTSTIYAAMVDCCHLLCVSGRWYVRLCAPMGGSNTFQAVKLELGSGQTLAHRDAAGKWTLNEFVRHKGMELFQCCMSTADAQDPYANNMMTAGAIGAAKIASGSYVGTGTYGVSRPCTLTFGFKPKFVMVYQESMGMLFGSADSQAGSGAMIAAAGASAAKRCSDTMNQGEPCLVNDFFTWSDNSFSWYTECADPDVGEELCSGVMQLNGSGVTYHYIAVG